MRDRAWGSKVAKKLRVRMRMRMRLTFRMASGELDTGPRRRIVPTCSLNSPRKEQARPTCRWLPAANSLSLGEADEMKNPSCRRRA